MYNIYGYIGWQIHRGVYNDVERQIIAEAIKVSANDPHQLGDAVFWDTRIAVNTRDLLPDIVLEFVDVVLL